MTTGNGAAMTDHPVAEMLDAMTSLTTLMEQETESLSNYARCKDQAAITTAKLRLTASIERISAQLQRERPDWLKLLNGENQQSMRVVIEALDRAAIANRDILDRQLSLTKELMDAVTAEVGRLSGTRAATYSATGMLVSRDQPTPISISSGL